MSSFSSVGILLLMSYFIWWYYFRFSCFSFTTLSGTLHSHGHSRGIYVICCEIINLKARITTLLNIDMPPTVVSPMLWHWLTGTHRKSITVSPSIQSDQSYSSSLCTMTHQLDLHWWYLLYSREIPAVLFRWLFETYSQRYRNNLKSSLVMSPKHAEPEVFLTFCQNWW